MMKKSIYFKTKLSIVLVFTTLIIVWVIRNSMVGANSNKTPPKAVNGVIDLRNWDFKKDGILKLDGQWLYYKEKLLYPEDFNGEDYEQGENYIIPGSYAEHGYGTYRLKLLLDETTDLYTINVDFAQSAYRLWVNNKEVISVGTVGKDKNSMKPQLLPKNGHFHREENEMFITLQVSNYYAKIGNLDNILIGNISEITAYDENRVAFDMFLFGATVLAAIYALGLYFFRKKDKSALYLSVVCIIIAIRTIFTGRRFFIRLFPSFSYIVLGKIMHWTFYLYIPFIVLFIDSFYPQIISRYIVKISKASIWIYLLLILLTPWKHYMDVIFPYQILAVFLLIYLVIKLSNYYLSNRGNEYIICSGILALLITAINDILYEYGVILTASFVPLGTLIFIITVSYVFAKRQSLAFANTEISKEKLKTINQLKDEFLSVISQELKTPLNGIIGLTEGLLFNQYKYLPEKSYEDLVLINLNAKGLSNLVEDILVFSKLKYKDITLNKRPLNLGKIVKGIIRFCDSMERNDKVEFVNYIDENSPWIYGDENRINQILFNLIGNSLKYTKEGSITLSYKSINNYVEICIEDTGVGVDKEKIGAILDRYEREEISSKSNGNELGLYITKKLVELHQGYISIDSTIGKGTKVIFTLPICPAREIEKLEMESIKMVTNEIGVYEDINNTKSKTQPASINQNSCKILIVDDDYINQKVLEKYLMMEDTVILKADYGKDAIDIIEKNDDLDLVILDMMMPDLLGYEVVNIIRERKSSFQLPILIMTADNRIENLTLAFEKGANDYLSKPFNKQELISRVTTLINLKYSVAEAISLAKRMNVVKKQVQDLNIRNAESERKMDKLIEYDKLKTEFFTNISHELRTPLNVISSTLQLINSLEPTKQLGDEAIIKYFKIMNKNCYRLLRLINNIIDINRFDDSNVKLRLKNCNIVSVIEDITQSVAEYIKSKNIDIIFDTDVEEKYLAIDEEKIERVMLNLLSNAVKFTDERGKIFINIEDLNDFVEIRVRDTGIGIPADKIDYVFERFAQVDKTTTRRTEGSGIGLSLVKSLIEMHNGSITLKSKLGEGSEFIMRLPVLKIDESANRQEDLMVNMDREHNNTIKLEFSDILYE